jgi:secreted Zn-dependent insulinase-like peptidase
MPVSSLLGDHSDEALQDVLLKEEWTEEQSVRLEEVCHDNGSVG